MKHSLFLLLLFCFGLHCIGQNFKLKIIGNTTSENKIIDSLNYISNQKNAKAISDEVNTMSARLSKIGFIENQILENTKTNDTSYVAKLSLGNRTKSIHIYIGKNSILNNLLPLSKKKDTLILPYEATEPFLNQTLQKLEQKGFALAKLKLINIHKQKQTLYAELKLDTNQQRVLHSIVVKFAEGSKKNSFPEGHLSQINKKYHNKTFNKEIVKQIHDDFEKFGFVSQVKYPEILFTKDTTKVYVYLEKRKSNTFDGFVGFSNNKTNKLIFNGYLDLALQNTLLMGEQFSLYWKSDGKNQKTFKANLELPYVFKSPIGLKAQIYIFKQDSIYQNTKTSLDLGYYLNYNTRIYLGYQSTESSDIQNTNSSTLSNYKNSFLTSNLEYSKFDYTNNTFPIKSKLSLIMGFGKRTANNSIETAGASSQFYINLQAMHNFTLNKKNYFNINYQNYYLKSSSYVINELYRFGGINSIRGFNENSLQANLLIAILTEYRYIVSPSLYLNTIMDYGYYQDKSTINQGYIKGFGFGIGLQTKNGLLKIALTNGSTKNQEIKFNNTIATINYNIAF